jgi:hypothetical protein
MSVDSNVWLLARTILVRQSRWCESRGTLLTWIASHETACDAMALQQVLVLRRGPCQSGTASYPFSPPCYPRPRSCINWLYLQVQLIPECSFVRAGGVIDEHAAGRYMALLSTVSYIALVLIFLAVVLPVEQCGMMKSIYVKEVLVRITARFSVMASSETDMAPSMHWIA